jgi:hypothetical protein
MRTTSAGFDFDVRLEGAADPLYSLSSRIGYDSGGNYYEDTAAAELALDNFQKVIGSTYSHAFTWDDTGVDIETGVTINPGESVTVIFTTTSIAYAVDASGFAFTDWSDPLNPYSNQVQTLVYASFGDPTGGKGGGGRRLAFSGASDPGLDGVNTNDFAVFEVPTEEVDEVNRTVIGSLVGKTTFLPKSEFPYGRPAGAVPEPASWAMMIAGLGLVGGVLRRRQPAPHSRHPIG